MNWDWDTIQGRLLAGIFLLGYRASRSAEEYPEMVKLAEQAEELLDATAPEDGK